MPSWPSASLHFEIVKICVCAKVKNFKYCVKTSYLPFCTGAINIHKTDQVDGVTNFCDVGKEGSFTFPSPLRPSFQLDVKVFLPCEYPNIFI
ncbi:hypothetical protein TNIN_130631 [Trichonephila inaurata madagascariensis]|uniref:Uncharacterized protein n=1 Tax=Trichonephila inaurata madagascariensis TaxID=2747483 RepID=A0A8X6XLP3_9ARAC|nr:hypothetical protein TNIN_130631 [Trichonephila inaurata madagascariensis]